MSAGRMPAAAWVGLHAALVITPLALAAHVDPYAHPRARLTEFAVAIGFLTLTIAVLQLALVSRVRTTSRRFGSDRLIALHRTAGVLALLFIGAHVVLLGGGWRGLSPLYGPSVLRWGALAFWALVLVVSSALVRRRVGLSYERWRAVHVIGAALVIGASTIHILQVHGYTASRLMWLTILGYATGAAMLLAYRWIVRPWQLGRRPWGVAANEDAGGDTRLLRLRPVGHDGFAFEAGQFAWLITGASAISVEQHPLSIASSAARAPRDGVEFAVKPLGDWSSTVVPALGAGDRVWVDGPYGALTPRGAADTRLVLIAGGIGIAPMRAILLTIADGHTRRPVTLIYAAARPDRAAFVDTLTDLAREVPFDLICVFEHADPGWPGERGRVSADLLRRRLRNVVMHEYLVCGPPAMIESVTRDLRRLGVPVQSIRAERFHLV
jgi:predicted ferric reductase